MSANLWQPMKVGEISLANRVAMAPMTCGRSTKDGVPNQMNAEYYAQRASMGLIVSEGTQPSDEGQGYLLTPGIYTEAHIAGWRKVTDAIHNAGGKIVIQLMHVGRIAHPANTLHGRQPLGPSAVLPNMKMFTMNGLLDVPEPRALEADDIVRTVRDFRHAAAAAMKAGADGVEIHGANGYLLHQFLSNNANQRTDNYGGSIANRIRFAVEVATAVADEIGGGRTGFRISPGNPFNDIAEHDLPGTYEELVRELTGLKLAYLHLSHAGDDSLLRRLRNLWPAALVLNRGGADMAARIADIHNGLADAITVGAMALANPDLVHRIKLNAPLNAPDPTTFYGGGAKGYIDYPTLDQSRFLYGNTKTVLWLAGSMHDSKQYAQQHKRKNSQKYKGVILMNRSEVQPAPSNSAIILVDHQPGVLAMVKSLPAKVVTTNAAILAKLGEEMSLPLVITTTREDMDFLGTTIKEVQKASPKAYAKRIRRLGTLNAFHDKPFQAAVEATNRKILILAGILTDVCLFNTAVSAIEAGYKLHIIADACGTSTELADDVTYDRLREMGAVISSTYGVLFELYPDLSTAEGQRAEKVASDSAKMAA